MPCFGRTFSALFAAIVLLSVSRGQSTPTMNVKVNTPIGVLLGNFYNGSQPYAVFRGVPYSEKVERFSPPQPLSPVNGIINCTAPAPVCPQNYEPVPYNPLYENEDCLHMDVYAPMSSNGTPLSGSSLPILVYIHGGGWQTGDGGLPLYRGDFFANDTQSPAIVCSVSYRLGAFGFLTTSAVDGNFGFLDQQMALRLCAEKIGPAFGGGGPSTTTLFGQSAGGISVAIHMTSPSSDGLFSRAVVESPTTVLLLNTVEQSYYFGDQFAQHLGCDPSDIACLRSASTQDVLTAEAKVIPKVAIPLTPNDTFAFAPVVDGVNILGSPLIRMNDGEFIGSLIETIWGTAKNDSAGFLLDPLQGIPLPVAAYDAALKIAFGNNASAVKEMYPVSRFAEEVAVIKGDIRNSISATKQQLCLLSTDWLFTCSIRAAARAMAEQTRNVRRYIFAHHPSTDPRATDTVSQCAQYDGLACHGSEVDYVWQTALFANASFTPEEQRLSDQLHSLWLQFAAGKLTEEDWPQYSASADNSLVFDLPQSGVVLHYRESFCDFWDSLGAYSGQNFQ